MQLSLFHTDTNQEQLREIDVEQLFEAYLSCRKTKRYTQNALKFEVDYEANLFDLKEEIENAIITSPTIITKITKVIRGGLNDNSVCVPATTPNKSNNNK